ncbi:MAG: hypothetical protein Ct9H300mP28_29780 [Pseudomonadota bacterium]|nr:MAG: hypothetical protein Ct9H300mP28_29780 [Pseudomonadota bacterium]
MHSMLLLPTRYRHAPLKLKTEPILYTVLKSNSLDSAAPTKPTGKPKITAGGSTPSSRTSRRRKSGVWGVSNCNTAPASLGRQI